MKRVPALLVIIILIGCSKNNDVEISIAGNWNLRKEVNKFYIDNKLAGKETITSGQLILTGDGHATSIDRYGNKYEGTYTYNSSTGVLVGIISGDTQTVSVTKLTVTDLHIAIDETNVDDGITYRATTDADYTR